MEFERAVNDLVFATAVLKGRADTQEREVSEVGKQLDLRVADLHARHRRGFRQLVIIAGTLGLIASAVISWLVFYQRELSNTVAHQDDKISDLEKLIAAIPATSRITAGKWSGKNIEQKAGWMNVQWELADGRIKLKFEPNKLKNPPFVLATSESLYRVYVEQVTSEYAILGTQGYPSSGHGISGNFWFAIIPNE